MTGPRAVWRLSAIPGWGGGLDITVAVDTTAPPVVAAIEQAARDNGLALERVAGDDPRFGELVGENELAGLVVAFKALVARAGGTVEITEAELQEARTLLARVDATPAVMTVELVEGAPPDGPRFERAEPELDRRARLREAIANGVDPARLPGLEPTLDRVEAALEPERDTHEPEQDTP